MNSLSFRGWCFFLTALLVVAGVAGHADQPDTFYMGSVGGGVWKTENAGRTWVPISDEGIPIGSIGAIAVAPSIPGRQLPTWLSAVIRSGAAVTVRFPET